MIMTHEELVLLLEQYRDEEISEKDAARVGQAIEAGGEESVWIMKNIEFSGHMAQSFDTRDSTSFVRGFFERLNAEETSRDFVSVFEKKSQRLRLVNGVRRPWYFSRVFWFSVASCIVLLVSGYIGTMYSAKKVIGRIITQGPGSAVMRNGEKIAAYDGMNVYPDDSIITGDTYGLTVGYVNEDTRIKIGEKTSLRLFEDGDGKRVEITSGTARASIARQPEGRSMVFITPQAEIRILGTQFTLYVSSTPKGEDQGEGGRTRLEVIEGRVELTRILDKKTVEIISGHYAVAGKDIELAVKPLNRFYVSPDGKETNKGTQESPWPLYKANEQVRPGDTIILLDGTYTRSIAPARSGKEGAWIVYCAAESAAPLFTDRYTAVVLNDRAYITIEGITVNGGVNRYVDGKESHHITINKCHFEGASGNWHAVCRFYNTGDHIRFTNNYVKHGGILLALGPGNGHLIEGNVFSTADQSCLLVEGITYSVVRNNIFMNPLGRCMEVFTASKEKDRGRACRNILIENNRFNLSVSSGIYYAGVESILRRNVFRSCRAGIIWAHSRQDALDPEKWHNRSNRFYHNILVDCGKEVISTEEIEIMKRAGSTPPYSTGQDGFAMGFQMNVAEQQEDYGDQVIINNIFFRNVAAISPDAVKTAQVVFAWGPDPAPSLCRISHNLIMYDTPGQPVLFWLDAKYQKPQMQQNFTLKEFDNTFPGIASGNIEADPMFVDPNNGDFNLRLGSPCIDTGGPLTRTVHAGTGTVVKVEDALFFTDGYGIIKPDIIRIGKERVKIVKVDYEKNELVIDTPVTWKAGTPVSLNYKGAAPDIGAFEYKEK